MQPVVDLREVRPHGKLDLALRTMIDRSDAAICIGTTNLMTSDWCRQEIEYLRSNASAKPYYPVLLDAIEDGELPAWFKGKVLPEQSEMVYANASATNPNRDQELRSLLESITNLRAISPGWIIAFALMLAMGLPALAVPLMGSGPLEGVSTLSIQREQSRIEGINKVIEDGLASGGAQPVAIVKLWSGPDRVTYRDKSTDGLVAEDIYAAGKLSRRVFYNADRTVAAVDDFDVQLEGPTEVCLLKRREIKLESGEVTIIDTYDSAGSLISKEVKYKGEKTAKHYADVGRSICPLIIAIGWYR
jgi:hypothetical protein